MNDDRSTDEFEYIGFWAHVLASVMDSLLAVAFSTAVVFAIGGFAGTPSEYKSG